MKSEAEQLADQYLWELQHVQHEGELIVVWVDHIARTVGLSKDIDDDAEQTVSIDSGRIKWRDGRVVTEPAPGDIVVLGSA